MLLDFNFDQACDFLESVEIIREDQVIPGHFRPCSQSPYATGFDWLYRYELKIASFLELRLQALPSDLIGEKCLLNEAMTNAFCHAHHGNTLKPITVRFLLGSQGFMIRVTDCGKGFNVQKTYKHCRKKRRYLTSVGNGIRLMAASPQYGVFHNQKGTAFHLIYLFEKELAELSFDRIATAPEHQVEAVA